MFQNQVIVEGYLGSEPRLQRSASGRLVCEFIVVQDACCSRLQEAPAYWVSVETAPEQYNQKLSRGRKVKVKGAIRHHTGREIAAGTALMGLDAGYVNILGNRFCCNGEQRKVREIRISEYIRYREITITM